MSSPVFGRDKVRDLLINKLISVVEQPNNTERKVPVHAIYGLGDAGKTTLAQFVYNDPRIAEHFEQRIWVHVSRKFEVKMITTKIIEGINKGGFPQVNNLDVLQTNLKDLLRSSEKFLIILDDVWCDDNAQWNQMLIPFNEVGYSNCRIVITARAEEVLKTLDVKHPFPIPELETSDFLSVFNYYSFGDAVNDTDKEFSEIAKKIVEKLYKSPLAAMMVGSLLKKKPSISFWNYILNQDMLEDTRNTLYLSFQQLPLHLRRCFAFCSLYPKGYRFGMYGTNNTSIVTYDLVLQWISHGYVEAPKSNELITLEEKGMQYFNELVSYSFFQKFKEDFLGDYYVIHDLLHDLTEKVSEEHYLRIEKEEPLTIPKTIMHLSIFLHHRQSTNSILSQIFELPNLRTILVYAWNYENELDDEFMENLFKKLKKLRVLCFKEFKAKYRKLPKSIGKLKYLRYLQYRSGELNESLGELYHVQYLDFGEYEKIDEVPNSINKLVNLQVFKPKKVLTSIPCLGKLFHLQHCEYCVSSIWKQRGIHDLKHLQEVQQLKIKNLQDVKNKGEASEASLKKKKFLNELELNWKSCSDQDGRNDEEVAESLEPPPNLSILKIDGYNGHCFPKWLPNDQHFSHLSKLSIKNCSKVKQLLTLPATLKKLWICNCQNLCEVSRLHPNLKVLEIRKCPGFEAMLSNILLFDVNHEEKEEEQKQKQHQHQLQPFRLKIMKIKYCSSRGEKRFDFGPKASLFTSLSLLVLCELSVRLERNMTSIMMVDIWNCENLKSFRSSLSSTTSSAKRLEIRECPMLARKQREAAATIKEWCFEELDINNLLLLNALVSSTSGNCLTSLKKLAFGYVDEIFSSEEEDLLEHLTLPSLESLIFSCCRDLPSLPLGLHKLSSLTSLAIYNCPKIESLPNLPASLKSLRITEANSELKRNYGEGGPLYHQISHIPDVGIQPANAELKRNYGEGGPLCRVDVCT